MYETDCQQTYSIDACCGRDSASEGHGWIKCGDYSTFSAEFLIPVFVSVFNICNLFIQFGLTL